MRFPIPVLALLALALTSCSGNDDAVEPAESPSPIATSASPTKTIKKPMSTATPEPTTEPPVAQPEPVATQPPATPEAAPLPDPATLTPGEYCSIYAPTSSGEEQLCYGIAQGYIDPVTGAYIGEPAAPVASQPEPPSSIDDFDPNDPSTWQGVDENGNEWAAIPPPPPGV
ncbi:hypothetical protein ACSNO4_00840 [Kocuria flava]|uniref:hypothetical protein n=1 Tax=Kocuria flava TaxID=446860 RepID=UPI003F1A96EC